VLACGGGDPYTIILFDPNTGREIDRLYGESLAHGTGRKLAFSPDSKRLYGPGLVWDVATRRGVARLPTANWHLTADGTLLVGVVSVQVPWTGPPGIPVPAVYVSRRVVQVWNTRTWAEVEAFAATGMGPAVAVSPDGRYVVLGGLNGVVHVYDRRERKELPRLAALLKDLEGQPSHFRREIARLVFSPDGKSLAVLTGGGDSYTGHRCVGLLSWPDGALAHKFPLSDSEPSSLVFTPDGRHLLAPGHSKSFAWEVSTGTNRGQADVHQKRAYGPAAVAPDGKRLFTTGPWHRLQWVRVPDLTPIPLEPPVPDTPPMPPFAIYQHPTGTRPNDPGWKLPDNTVIRHGGIGRGEESFGVLHFDAEGRLIRYYLHRKSVGFDVTSDGKLMATYGHDDTPGGGRRLPLQFWDLTTGNELASAQVDTPWPFSYQPRFSPDGTRLAMLHTHGLARVWDVSTRKPVLNLEADGVAVSELIYSADGRFIIGTGGSGPAVVWDATGKE
jgi:WD40 repeat protein